jgi:hypothetical protein
VGATEPAGTGTAVILNFLLFEPGVELPNIGKVPTSFGYPSVTVLQNPTVPFSPSVISDFCSPLVTTTTNNGVTEDNPSTSANEGGVPYRTNPADAGFYNVITLAYGQRDGDGDGHENSLDTCPFLPLPNWDPRSPDGGGADPDKDGLPDDCDPDPANISPPAPQPPDCALLGNSGPDEDQDCYSNRQDNCPVNDNFDQEDTDDDGIGDACDTEGAGVSVEDGERPLVCIVHTITIGSPTGTAPPFDCEAALAAGDAADGGDDDGGDDAGTNGDTGGNGGGGGGGVGGPSTGVGALAPAASSVPAWAAIASGLGVTGILSSVGGYFLRIFRRRRE